ncbi:MAG TPA: hypothetical protein VFB20_03950 [Burkholderiales bacterium]|nr:hypothetical protein [Burkholderiales bacterium]
MTTHAQADDFDVGKAIFDQLKDLPPERQQRILRWVAEGLGTPSVPLAAALQSSAAAKPASSGQLGGSGATDIKSFIGVKAPKSDQQFAAAVAYFYRFEAPPAERRDSINGELLQEAARLAGRKRLTSPRATLNNAKAAGYLDGTSRGEFSINSVGENLVAMALPGGVETAARAVKKNRARKPASKAKPKTANKAKKR